mmetsp:Transcript_5847/g.8489  ORF Transcript_5847/g.8489 Transcript_5847/m.8489 type:complete len:335 (+) Transcript_5847:149-1153(+)
MRPSSNKRSLPDGVGSSQTATKRLRGGISVGSSRNVSTSRQVSTTTKKISKTSEQENLREIFIALFSNPAHKDGVSNSALKAKFGNAKYLQLVPIINDLTRKSRLNMSKIGDELYYSLVSDEVASRFAGLDNSARMVYQVIEKAGNMGSWIRDIHTQTSIQQQTLTKIVKVLETRKLIKPVKSVTAKTKKLYMLYDLTPAKEITGGTWYTELEFDHEFISELRTFIMLCVRRMKKGKGVTISEISTKMKEANVSRVELSHNEVQQLMQTLAFDYMIEQSGVNQSGEALFIPAKKVTTMCDFKWWDVLCPDFHFRNIKFEDGVTLSCHEPHHHTA